ncbi:MAG: thiamine ABC transporter substrate-binding protein, partial [Bdellovibrionota bacterium]
MRHFIAFLAVISSVLFLYFINKGNQVKTPAAAPHLRVYSYASFTQAWGPGPLLKQKFKEKTGMEIDFIESPDSGVLLQRLKLEGPTLGADMVIGLDQYDLKRALGELQWKKIDFGNLIKEQGLDPQLENEYFVPYDWGILSFIARKGTLPFEPQSLDDLLDPRLRDKIAYEDPRTSSPGLQFLFWVHNQKKSKANDFMKSLFAQAHSFSPSWSQAYGLFQKKQALMVFSYVTSTLYHEIEEKNFDTYFLKFKEPHPVQ